MDLEVTPEFSAWFKGLTPEQAEEVATALDMLGSDAGADFTSSTSVLFYDDVSEDKGSTWLAEEGSDPCPPENGVRPGFESSTECTRDRAGSWC